MRGPRAAAAHYRAIERDLAWRREAADLAVVVLALGILWLLGVCWGSGW